MSDSPARRIKYHFRAFPVQCQAEPATMFVFGDNMIRRGTAGQACIRREPNAIGVPTKWNPAMTEGSFFADEGWPDQTADALKIKIAIDKTFLLIETHAAVHGAVSFPRDGLGTGLAQLPQRAPKIAEYIAERIRNLEERYGR